MLCNFDKYLIKISESRKHYKGVSFEMNYKILNFVAISWQ